MRSTQIAFWKFRFLEFNITGILTNFRVAASASQKRTESQSPAVGSSWKLFDTGPPISENLKRSRGHRRQDSLQESIFTMSAQELK